MLVYIIVILLTSIFCAISQQCDYRHDENGILSRYNHTSTTRFFFVLAAIVLIFVAGFRYYVGTDYGGYYNNYNFYASSFFESLKTFEEPGFRFICWIIVLLKGNGTVVIFVSSLITVLLYLRIIYKNTNMLLMATLLYIFLGCWHGAFNGVRQYLASAILFAGLPFIKERKFWKYAVTVFIAFLFHSSAILMIFAYFIAHNRINFRNIILLILGSVVILFSFTEVLELAGFILNNEYSDSNTYITNSVNILRVLVAIVPAVFFLIVYWGSEITDNQKFWINLLILNGIVMFATSNSTYLARMGIYTAPFSAIAIPELIKGISKRDKKIVTAIILVAFAAFWWYDVSHSQSLNNFQFIFNR